MKYKWPLNTIEIQMVRSCCDYGLMEVMVLTDDDAFSLLGHLRVLAGFSDILRHDVCVLTVLIFTCTYYSNESFLKCHLHENKLVYLITIHFYSRCRK